MGSLSPAHWALIILAFIVLFGYKRLPDASRSIGRSLRILKAETKGLREDETAPAAPTAPAVAPVAVAAPVAAATPVTAAPVAPGPVAAVPVAAVPAPEAAPVPRFDPYTGQPLVAHAPAEGDRA